MATEIWRVEDGHVTPYKGNYTEYLWLAENGTAARMGQDKGQGTGDKDAAHKGSGQPLAATSQQPSSGGKKTKEQKRAEAEARNAAYRSGPSGPSTASKPSASNSGNGAAPKPAPAAPSAAASGNAKHLRKQHEATERQIAAKEAEKTALEARLADPALYADAAAFQQATADYTAASAALERLYADWEASATALG